MKIETTSEMSSEMLQLPQVFQDGMMLQRGKVVTLWGSGKPGEMVEVSIQGKQGKTQVGRNGNWEVHLEPLAASERETLQIVTDEENISITNVAVGEIFLAAGQSNMEFPLCYEKHWQQEQMQQKNTSIRFYDVPEVCYEGQDQEFDYSHVGIWRHVEEESFPYFSAAGYYFQKEIAENEKVPVGIIGCNWGGTRSAAWMNEETVARVAPGWVKQWEQECDGTDMEKFWESQHNSPMNDRGNPNMDAFSKFMLPRTPSIKEIGQFFAQMTQTGEKTASLAEADEDLASILAAQAQQADPKNQTGCLYEHMVKKIAPYTIRGVLWYQGESDDVVGLQACYAKMLSGLIEDWRKLWKDDLPFFVVQLPGWYTWLMNTGMDYPAIRKCQEEVTKEMEKVYLCSISDAGEEDIHPKDKLVVGHRLALLAEKYCYGKDILADAPVLENITRDKNVITLTFGNVREALHIDGESVAALTVTCQQKEMPYDASVKKNQLVLLMKEETDKPLKISFAQQQWYLVNLYNDADIPAIPFLARC